MKWIGYIVMCILGLGAAFFGVLNVLFSDVLSSSDWVSVILYIAILYATIGLVGALLWPRLARAFQWWIWVPALVAAILISLSEPTRILIHAGILALAVLTSWFGLAAGARMRNVAYRPFSKS